MKINKKLLLIPVVVAVVVFIAVYFYYYREDINSLTVTDKNWIEENVTSLVDIEVITDYPIYGDSDSAVFGSFISGFEEALATYAILTVFMPMVMGTGGNAGGQASVTIIRALSLDEVEFKIYDSRIGDKKSGICGEVVSIYKDGIGIMCSDREIIITDIKPFGKKRMLVNSYLNGIDKNSLIGKVFK